ncbi:hypothetical protein ARMGADRAFT_1072561 [Armillaria gallica]|uniref:Uncharacterized protein n=1 Tax=Armillaria gallica TaxID=47427 RepID=A0A2H3E8Y3_ARMGA|nr:hypothetical protein ARMGADRAFT_1072561 [Armillaria gallica]
MHRRRTALHVQLQLKWQQLSPQTIQSALSKRYVKSLEDKVERMENLLRKILPPEVDSKEELDAVQTLPEDASRTLFNITSFTSLRPEFWDLHPWNHSRRYVPQGMSLGFPPGNLMPMHILFTSIALSVLSRSTFDKSLKEGFTAEHDLL